MGICRAEEQRRWSSRRESIPAIYREVSRAILPKRNNMNLKCNFKFPNHILKENEAGKTNFNIIHLTQYAQNIITSGYN